MDNHAFGFPQPQHSGQRPAGGHVGRGVGLGELRLGPHLNTISLNRASGIT
jgi:hypothetical protein